MLSVLLKDISNQFNKMETNLSKSAERNNDLIRTLATIRQKLERTLRNKNGLNDAVYDCINLCRENLPSGPNWEYSPPLKEEEKTL